MRSSAAFFILCSGLSGCLPGLEAPCSEGECPKPQICQGGVCLTPATDSAQDSAHPDGEPVDAGHDACVALPERCNGRDDDCNGKIDEGFGLNSLCSVTIGTCPSQGVLQCNATGGTFCKAEPTAPSSEVCNLLDDDCDGETDEDEVCYASGAPSREVGRCHPGITRCIGGQRSECEGAIGPVSEICNQIDDDCDGEVDNGVECSPCLPNTECYGGPDGTIGVGICKHGQSECLNGQLVACQGSVEPELERCNGLDDDCNGEIDDVLQTDCIVGRGVCASIGTTICADGLESCSANENLSAQTVESCNGLDDNCNGIIDDNLNHESCSYYINSCLYTGEYRCIHSSSQCIGLVEITDEICNSIDDDCDGQIDEDFNIGAICNELHNGCNLSGLATCNSTGGVFCKLEIPTTPETCNNRDDDCDGLTDEDSAGNSLTEPCYDGAPETAGVGACHYGQRTCESGTYGECLHQVTPRQETCNNIDDDCNGIIDDIGNIFGPTCGINQCIDGRLQLNKPVLEVCNGWDDDCDSAIDEDRNNSPLRETCYSRNGQCGLHTCVNGQFGSCLNIHPPEAEVCDDFDNDCDRSVDEDCVGCDFNVVSNECINRCRTGYTCNLACTQCILQEPCNLTNNICIDAGCEQTGGSCILSQTGGLTRCICDRSGASK